MKRKRGRKITRKGDGEMEGNRGKSKGKGKKNKFRIRNSIRFLKEGVREDLSTFGKNVKRKKEKKERKEDK